MHALSTLSHVCQKLSQHWNAGKGRTILLIPRAYSHMRLVLPELPAHSRTSFSTRSFVSTAD